MCSAKRFALGTLASGLLWGSLCAGLALWGSRQEFLLMSLVTAGMTAGAMATFSAYLPAFAGYAGAFTIPLAIAALTSGDPVIAGNGILSLLYLLVISLTARHNGMVISRTIELQVDNSILQRSLTQTRIERDHAQVDKWSTMTQLSHELRTPLNAILGFSETMHQEFFGPLGARYREYAGHIHESGRQLLKLTEELLDLSRGESGGFELRETTIDVRQLVHDMVRQLSPDAQKAGLSLNHEVAANLPKLRGDETKVRQMLLNLVDNALKFTPPGGKVCVTAGHTTGQEIYLSVRDSGIGMEEEDIPVALLPLGRLATSLVRSTDGAGLGLPICKRLAELHGATLMVDSKPRVGTTCTIQFPPERSVLAKQSAAAA
jgi:signal transduction histidine kinase